MVKSKLGRVEAEVVIRSINNRERKHRNLLRQYWPTIVFQLTNADNYAYQVFFFYFSQFQFLTRISLKFFYYYFFLLKILIVLCASVLIDWSLVIWVDTILFIETVPLDYIYNDVRWILLYRCIPKEIFNEIFKESCNLEKNIRTNFKNFFCLFKQSWNDLGTNPHIVYGKSFRFSWKWFFPRISQSKEKEVVSSVSFSLTHKFPLFRLSIFFPKKGKEERFRGLITVHSGLPWRGFRLAIHEDGSLFTIRYVFLHVSLPVNDIAPIDSLPMKSYPYSKRRILKFSPRIGRNFYYVVGWKGKLVSNLETVRGEGQRFFSDTSTRK